MKVVTHQDKSIKYHIERKAIKHAYFRVKDGYMHITANKRMSEDQIVSYMLSKFDVFYHRIEKRKPVIQDNSCHLWGKPYRLEVTTGTFEYKVFEDYIWIQRPQSKEHTWMKDILKIEMTKKLPEILKDIEYRMTLEHIPLCPIKLKFLKSKFGSYHRKKHEITLNTFLATLHPIYLTYVMYHEYAHALVFNHSKAFYQVLDRWMHNHKSIQKDLKKIAII